jgi:hypothetical protein
MLKTLLNRRVSKSTSFASDDPTGQHHEFINFLIANNLLKRLRDARFAFGPFTWTQQVACLLFANVPH